MRTRKQPRNPEPVPGETIIAHGMEVRGNIASDTDVRVDGRVEGNITSEMAITLEENAYVEGSLSARYITISSRVHGNISASENLTCTTTAEVYGDISTPRLSVESGALIAGNIDMPLEAATDDLQEV